MIWFRSKLTPIVFALAVLAALAVAAAADWVDGPLAAH